jgi:hypothetical protein
VVVVNVEPVPVTDMEAEELIVSFVFCTTFRIPKVIQQFYITIVSLSYYFNAGPGYLPFNL